MCALLVEHLMSSILELEYSGQHFLKVHYVLPRAMRITERTVQDPLPFQFLCQL